MAEWKHISGEIGLNPDFIAKIKPPIDAIFQSINLTLDLLQEILSFVKNFLVDFTQPIKIIIDALVEQLKALLSDLKQMGVYFTSDTDLIPSIKKSGLEKFSGGYGGFENRMVEKLTNLNDLSRPNFSTSTGAISLFVVATADLSGIVTAINLVMEVIELLTGKSKPSPDPDPVNIKGEITQGFFPVNIKNSVDYDGVKISWDITPPPGASSSAFPSFVNPPKSFLIHVRTRPEPFYIGYKYKPKNKTGASELFRGIYFLDGIPARVSGDVELYTIGDPSSVYFLEDPSSDQEYTLNMVKNTGYTFYYEPSSIGSFLTGSSYSLKLEKERIPKTYEYDIKKKTYSEVPTSKLYIEIVSCSTNLGGVYSDGAKVTQIIQLPKADLPNFKAISSVKTTPIVSRGEVTLPLPETKDYFEALKNALAIYFLGGYFLDNEMGLSDETQANIRAYLNLKKTDMDLINSDDFLFRERVDFKISVILSRMNLPSQTIIQSLKKDIPNLTKPYLKDPRLLRGKTTLYTLVKDNDLISGISSNYLNFYGKENLDKTTELFPEPPLANLPVIYYTGSEMESYDLESTQINAIKEAKVLKTLLNETEGTENILVRDSARKFLDYLPRRKKPSGTGAWENFRFFEDGIPEFEEFIKLIIDFLESFSLGLGGIIKAIKDYIDLIILKIEELQVLINKIKSIIDNLLNFKIGAGISLLYSLNEGTRGIVENLTNSTNKPPKTTGETFGFGACFVFGGYPAFLPALLSAFAGD